MQKSAEINHLETRDKLVRSVIQRMGYRYKLVGYIPALFIKLPAIQEPIFESDGILYKALFNPRIDQNKIAAFIPISKLYYKYVRKFENDDIEIYDKNAYNKIKDKDFSVGSRRVVPFEIEDKYVFIGDEDDFIKFILNFDLSNDKSLEEEIMEFLMYSDQFQ